MENKQELIDFLQHIITSLKDENVVLESSYYAINRGVITKPEDFYYKSGWDGTQSYKLEIYTSNNKAAKDFLTFKD